MNAAAGIEQRLPRLPVAVLAYAPNVERTPKKVLAVLTPAEPPREVDIETASIEPEAKPVPPDVSIETAGAEPDTIAAVQTTTSEALSPAPPPPLQRVAALPEPMHLLPDGPTTAETDVEVIPKPRNNAVTKKVKAHPRSVQQPQTPRQPSPKKAEAEPPSKIPKWAQQMFDANWQNRAFAYQR